MAIAFRSATEAGTGSASANLSVNVPSGVQNGDLLLLFGVTADGDDGGFDAITGWTEILDAATFNTGGAAPSPPGMSVWWRIASSEPASYTITPTFGNTGICANMLAFTGVDGTTPIDVTSVTATGDGANADPGSITPTTDGALTVVAAFWDSTSSVYTSAPTGYTNSGALGDIVGSGGGNGCTMVSAYRNSVIDPAAAENPGAFTSSAEQWGAPTIALRPEPAGITSVTPSEFDMDNADVDVASTGGAFDASGNDVYISDADTLAGSVNEVDISSAINTEATTLINLDLTLLSGTELGNLHTLGPGARYVIVDAVGGEYSWPITLHRPQAFVISLGAGTPGATTARLTAPATKTTADFDAGRFEEAANPATAVDITADDYTEMVWSIEAKDLSREVSYDFRVTKNGNVIDTYTVTPQVTVAASIIETIPNNTLTLTGIAPLANVTGSVVESIPSTILNLNGIAPATDITPGATELIPNGLLTLTSFAPLDSITGHVRESIPSASLTLLSNAPLDYITGHARESVPNHTLTLTSFAPATDIIPGATELIPGTNLSLTSFVPNTDIGPGATEQIPAISLTLTGLAPTDYVTGGVLETVPGHTLTLIGIAPIARVSTDNVLELIPSSNIFMTSFAPVMQVTPGATELIPSSNLILTGFAPATSITGHVQESIPVAALVLVGIAPTAQVLTENTVEPVPNSNLILVSFAPSTSVIGDITEPIPNNVLQFSAYVPSIRNTGAVTPAAARPAGGISKRVKQRKHRQIMVDGRMYTIDNPQQELMILQGFLDKLERQFTLDIQKKKVPAVKRKIKLGQSKISRVKTRIKKVETRVQWLRKQDQEILALLVA